MAGSKPSPLKSLIDSNRYLRNIINNIDLNDNNNKQLSTNGGKYALKNDFIPRSKAEFTAQEIAIKLGDTQNFNSFISAVFKIGSTEAYRLCQETIDDIEIQRKIGKPVKKPGAVFQWKVKQLNLRGGNS